MLRLSFDKAGETLVGPSLHGEISSKRPQKTSTQVRNIIVKGHGPMPGFQNMLSVQDIDNLLTYIRTL
jgi:mono/diheme cytochrome c family protein